MPDIPTGSHGLVRKWIPLWEGLAAYQLDGGVTAYHGTDG